MKNFLKDPGFWIDPIALVAAAVGIVLMTLTTIWRLNCVESSVITAPDWVTGNACVFWFFLGSCVPASIITAPMIMVSVGLYMACRFLVQGLIFFMIGKGISVVVRKLKEESAR